MLIKWRKIISIRKCYNANPCDIFFLNSLLINTPKIIPRKHNYLPDGQLTFSPSRYLSKNYCKPGLMNSKLRYAYTNEFYEGSLVFITLLQHCYYVFFNYFSFEHEKWSLITQWKSQMSYKNFNRWQGQQKLKFQMPTANTIVPSKAQQQSNRKLYTSEAHK